MSDGMVTRQGEVTMPERADEDAVVLCAASAYEEKFYFNEDFGNLPESIKQELQIMCVLYTAEIGGILTLQFDGQGNLLMHVTAREDDYLFDEIGSVLKIKQLQSDKRELMESLELYYRAVMLGEEISEYLEGEI